MPQLPVTPGAQRRNRGWAGRWSHWQPASARRGSGTAQCAWRSAGTGGSSHVSHTGWGLWDAGLGASPVGQQPSHQHPQPQLRPHPPAELSMTDTTHAPKAHTQPSSAQGRMERQRCSKRTRDTWPQTAAQGPLGWGTAHSASSPLGEQGCAGWEISRAGTAGFGAPQEGTWRPWGCPCRLSSTVLFLPLALSTCCTDHVFFSDQ